MDDVRIDAVSWQHLVSALRLGQDNESLVDAYYGPEELRLEAARIALIRSPRWTSLTQQL